MQDELLKRVMADSRRFAEQSALVSELLQQAEEFLQELPGKVEVRYADGGFCLSFESGASDWRLVLTDEKDGQRYYTATAAIIMKARAAKLLPGLWDAMCREQQTRLEQIEEAVDSLQNLPFLAAKRPR